MQNKTIRLKKYLAENQLENFFEIIHEEEADLLRLSHTKNGMTIQCIADLDDSSNCSNMRFFVTKCNSPIKQEKIIYLLNELNKAQQVQYFLDEDGCVYGNVYYYYNDNTFECETLIRLVASFTNSILDNDTSKIMKAVWG